MVLLIQLALIAGLALLLAMANLFFRDVRYLFEVLIAVGLFGTAVVYPLDAVGGRLQDLLALNPMTLIIEAYRASLLAGQVPELVPLLATGLVSLGVLFVGWLCFHRSEPAFAERI